MFAQPRAMSQPFPPLSEADFDAYLAARATSNTFVRARIPVKERLLELGRALAERALAHGLALEVGASDERPSVWNQKSVTCQWVFLWRDRAARAELERASDRPAGLSAALIDPMPYDKHAFLALYLDPGRFEVCLRMHRDAWADVKSAQRRIETEPGRDAMSAMLAALPEDIVVSVIGGESLPVRRCDVSQLGRLLDDAVATGTWLSLARSVSRAEAIAAGPQLVVRATEAFDALVPAYRALAWSPADDPAAVADDMVRNAAARDAHLAEAKARDEAWTAEHTLEIQRRRSMALVEARERSEALERARPGAVQAATAAIRALCAAPHEMLTSRRVPLARLADPRPTRDPISGPSSAQRMPAVEGSAATSVPTHFPLLSDVHGGRDFLRAGPGGEVLEKMVIQSVANDRRPVVGSRVQIRQGTFAGRVGTVTEVLSRGDARVAIGALCTRIGLADLVRIDEKA